MKGAPGQQPGELVTFGQHGVGAEHMSNRLNTERNRKIEPELAVCALKSLEDQTNWPIERSRLRANASNHESIASPATGATLTGSMAGTRCLRQSRKVRRAKPWIEWGLLNKTAHFVKTSACRESLSIFVAKVLLSDAMGFRGRLI